MARTLEELDSKQLQAVELLAEHNDLTVIEAINRINLIDKATGELWNQIDNASASLSDSQNA